MTVPSSGPERDRALDEIRSAYAPARERGRVHLWDADNRGYARLIADRDRLLIRLIRQASGPGPARLLDVGCGTGGLGVVLRDEAVSVTYDGLDLLPARVTEARKRLPDARIVVGSADSMPYPDRSFQVVVAATLFSSLPGRDLEHAVAAEIDRVLADGGTLVWYDLRYSNPGNPAVHGVPLASIKRLFPNWGASLASYSLLPPIARRLGPLTPALYPLLHAVPPLRSHLIGTLRRPG